VGGLFFGFVLLWFLLEVPSRALTGRTLGKSLLGLRVVRTEDGSARLGVPRAVARWLLRIVNGVIGSPASRLAEGDALGRVAPSLSLFNGVGAGTLVVAEGEFQRLGSLDIAERRRALVDTLWFIEGIPDTVSARAAWINTLLVTVVVLASLVSVLGIALSSVAA
jgi:hypothetical protein